MDNAKKFFLKHWLFFTFLVILIFVFIFQIRQKPLTDWDECIYTEYAREMKVSRNFFTYHWNNGLVFEKPPLYGWLLQIPYLFGVNEFASRLPSVILGISLLSLLYFFSYQYFSLRVGTFSILIMLLFGNFVLYTTKVNTDIGFSFFIFAGFYTWMISRKRARLSYVSGFIFGLAVMFKGLSTLVFILPITILSFSDRRHRNNILMLLKSFLVTIIPWHLYQLFLYRKAFLQEYFIDSLWTRSTHSIFPQRNLFFYFQSIEKDMFPWSLFILLSFFLFIWSMRTRLNKQAILDRIEKHKVFTTVVFITIIPPLFFSLVKTRIIWYLIPIYPFIAIITAYSMNYVLRKFQVKTLAYVIVFILLIQVVIVNFQVNQLISLDATFSAEAGFNAKKLPADQIEYLIGKEYRYLRQKADDLGLIKAQLRYGDNPCILFYSQKKLNLYYSKDFFQKRLKSSKGLFLIQKEDKPLIKGLITHTVYQNHKFILFTN